MVFKSGNLAYRTTCPIFWLIYTQVCTLKPSIFCQSACPVGCSLDYSALRSNFFLYYNRHVRLYLLRSEGGLTYVSQLQVRLTHLFSKSFRTLNVNLHSNNPGIAKEWWKGWDFSVLFCLFYFDVLRAA